jgi:T5SS/PEP-CTERM-associated repeat protein
MANRILILFITVCSALSAARAHVTAKTWIGSDGGSFSTPGNWSPTGTPGTADSIIFANGTVASTYDINVDVNATVTQLTVATNPLAFAGASNTLSLTSTSTVNSSRALLIGRTGSGTNNASLTSSLAQLNTTYAVLGADTGSTGTLNVTAGTFSVTGTASFSDLLIGDSGTGNINVSGGAHVTVASETSLATFAASIGNISVIGSGSTWTNTGEMGFLKGTGTITVADGGSLSANARLSLGFGKLAGNGTVSGSISNSSGTVAPSSLTSSFGTLNISGIYTQTTNGKLQIELGGTTAGTNYDRLHVSAGVTLGGTLEVTLSSFTPAQNNVFDILDFSTRTGTFATVTLPTLPGSLEWDTSKLYTDGTIRVVLPGDFNNSGTVDAADYAAWRKGLNTTYTPSDYDVWRTHFGRTAAGTGSSLAASTSVPEPTSLTLTLLTIGAVTIARLRQRNSRREFFVAFLPNSYQLISLPTVSL